MSTAPHQRHTVHVGEWDGGRVGRLKGRQSPLTLDTVKQLLSDLTSSTAPVSHAACPLSQCEGGSQVHLDALKKHVINRGRHTTNVIAASLAPTSPRPLTGSISHR